MKITRTIREPLEGGGRGKVLCILEVDDEGPSLVTLEGKVIYTQSWEGFALQMLYTNPFLSGLDKSDSP